MTSNMTLPRAWPKWPLSKRMQWLREKSGLSVPEAAKATSCAESHIWELEHGHTANPRLSTLLSICRAYNIPVERLTEGL